MTVGGLAYDWMLIDADTDAKSRLTGWKWLFLAGIVVVELEKPVVLLLLLGAGRIQSFLWLHHWNKLNKFSWQQTPVHSYLEIVGQNSKPFYNKKEERICKLTFQWDCEGLWWAKICIHRRNHSPIIHAHPRCWGSLAQQGYWGLEIYHHTRIPEYPIQFDHVDC